MPYDEYPECPECGDASGECGYVIPFNFPTIYLAPPNPEKELCVGCNKNKRLIYEDMEYDICGSCLNKLSSYEHKKHIIEYRVVA